MSFEIVYHEKVISDDIPKLSSANRRKIKNAIEEKLFTHPEIYGKPLRQSLKNFRKLRVGDYRVIFCIEGAKIKILIIAHRSIVYSNGAKR